MPDGSPAPGVERHDNVSGNVMKCQCPASMTGLPVELVSQGAHGYAASVSAS